jgi:hypothetical protein
MTNLCAAVDKPGFQCLRSSPAAEHRCLSTGHGDVRSDRQTCGQTGGDDDGSWLSTSRSEPVAACLLFNILILRDEF